MTGVWRLQDGDGVGGRGGLEVRVRYHVVGTTG